MIEDQSLKTRLLHVLRSICKLSFIESWLARQTRGASMNSFLYKIVPHSYTYPGHSYRILDENGLRFKLDISDFLGHAIYFGYDNEESRSYQYLLGLVKPGFHCLDIGTNIGYVSIN